MPAATARVDIDDEEEEQMGLRTDESLDREMDRARERHEEQVRNLEVVMGALRAERNEREARSERERMERVVARRYGVRDGRVERTPRGHRGGTRARGGRGVRRSGGGRNQRSNGRGRGCVDGEDLGLIGLYRTSTF